MNVTLYNGGQLPGELSEAWSGLQRAETALDHPLLHPAWMELVAGVRDDVHVAVLHEADVPVGFFPFERRGRTGRPLAACMSDLHGLIARPGTDVCMRELLQACGLSVWHFDHVPAEQPWLAPFTARIEDAPVIDLGGGFEQYWQRRQQEAGSWTTQTLRKGRKLAREVGPLRFQWHTPNEEAWTSLVEWKRQQLLASDHFDVFALPWFAALLRRVGDVQTAALSGVLSTLRAGDQLVAVHLGICNHRVLVSWIPTYNSQYARYSPGALLHLEMARSAAQRGLEQIELGRGLNPLKRALGSSARRLAIGAVDLRPGHAWCRARWFQLRDLVHAIPLGGLPLRTYRRVRNWAGSPSA